MESWEGDNSHAPIIEAVQSALASPSLPPEILTQLLNLAEFMELQDKVRRFCDGGSDGGRRS